MTQRTRVHLYLPTQILENLDRLCEESLLTRSEFLRRALEAHMFEVAERAKAACTGYPKTEVSDS